jgi:sulfate transport system ATP-binding protein
MYIEVNNLIKTFGTYAASDNISFGIEKGRLIGLLGPSGGGKTTILRMLAGLDSPDSGDIYIDGKRVNDVPAQQRGIGFVFQNYALFRHMTVYDNIAFGLTVQKRSKSEIKARVSELIELTGLKGLDKRYPNQLSGGQRQRVAFARALAPEPHLLLLDEPFAAIDAKVRKELRAWLKATIERIGITTIFVTHDQEEAVEVADEIMIVSGGRLEQKGSPIDIYKNPLSPFVAGFIGESSQLDNPGGLKGFEEELPGTKAIIRPEFVEIGKIGELPTPLAAEAGIVRDVFFRGNSWQVEVQIGSQTISAYRSLEKDPLKTGDSVNVLIHRLYLFNDKHSRISENSMKTDPMPYSI